MISLDDLAPWLAFAATAAATPLLAHVALRWTWIDRRDGDLAERKPRTRPVALVGGAALLLGLLAFQLASSAGSAPHLPWMALVGAFLLGLVDDLKRGGLPALGKFAGQVGVGVLLALEPGLEWHERILRGVLCVVAQNAVNTFDNADGAATSLGLLACAPHAGARAVLLGFLPFNLLLGHGKGPKRVPLAYLGDSGSHLLGVLFAWLPGAEIALLLPLLDLARLVVVRWRAGQAPWLGDRRHLAHRLEAAGLSPVAVALALVVIAAPPFLAPELLAQALTPGSALALGVLASLALFSAAVRWTPNPKSVGATSG